MLWEDRSLTQKWAPCQILSCSVLWSGQIPEGEVRPKFCQGKKKKTQQFPWKSRLTRKTQVSESIARPALDRYRRASQNRPESLPVSFESASWYESIILSSSSYFHHHHQHNQLFTPKVNKKSLVYIQPSPDYCTEVNNWHNEMRCWDKGHTSLAFIIVFSYI